MKTKHTPGPWRASETLCTQHTPVHTLVKTDFGGHVAACFYGANDAERLANARLIAAAPDLLAALKRFAAHCEQRSLPELQGVACDAFAAIAKAEGAS